MNANERVIPRVGHGGLDRKPRESEVEEAPKPILRIDFAAQCPSRLRLDEVATRATVAIFQDFAVAETEGKIGLADVEAGSVEVVTLADAIANDARIGVEFKRLDRANVLKHGTFLVFIVEASGVRSIPCAAKQWKVWGYS